MPRVTRSTAHKELLGELYRQTTRTVDDLPYTDECEALHAAFCERSGAQMTRHDVWKALADCRKQSWLVRKKRA